LVAKKSAENPKDFPNESISEIRKNARKPKLAQFAGVWYDLVSFCMMFPCWTRSPGADLAAPGLRGHGGVVITTVAHFYMRRDGSRAHKKPWPLRLSFLKTGRLIQEKNSSALTERLLPSRPPLFELVLVHHRFPLKRPPRFDPFYPPGPRVKAAWGSYPQAPAPCL
jgi:hypothetical protein